MKFLCTSCNTQMKLVKNEAPLKPDDHGSLSIRYECPDCLMEIAMLTNAFETQMVTSMGVEIGGETVSKSQGITLDESGNMAEANAEPAAKCPFSQMARDSMMEASETDSVNKNEDEFPWTAQAMVRLQNIPEFARPMAKKGIEKFAHEKGFTQVTEECLDRAKEEFEM